ncbi:MAG: ATP-binding protein [Candidatus Helarchaeota archaeon]|nr:ATP-binding protein [Candidatus Helarchaeota archaeon]
MDSRLKPQYSLTITSERSSIENAVTFAERVANEMNLIDEEYDNLAISISEAVSNAIIHGNKLDKNKKVKISIFVKRNNVTVIVKDQGSGFDPKKLKNPLDPENIPKEYGRGIFVLRNLMDTVDFNFVKSGTEVIFSKNYKKNSFKK